jgi:hypothetical protein
MPVIVPFADWRPLPEATSQPKITPRVVVFHTAVGRLATTERYFRDHTGVESHLMVGGPWDGPELDGVIWQWMTLDRQADANLDANAFAISIETSDNAPASAADLAPWSQPQLVSLVRLGNWLAERFAIPRRQCPAWDAAGFGWHAMWGAPSHWTPSAGKVCPGSRRIAQLKTIVLPAIFAGRDLEEDDLTNEQAAQLKAVHDALLAQHAINPADPIDALYDAVQKTHRALIVPGTTTADEAFDLLFARVRKIEATLQDVQGQVESVGDEFPESVGDDPPVSFLEALFDRVRSIEKKVEVIAAALPVAVGEPPPEPPA